MKYLIFIVCLLLLTFNVNAQDVYSYGDTLRIVSNLSSGHYSSVDGVDYFIYSDIDQAITGTYLANGSLVFKAGSGDVDSLFVAEWPIPSTTSENIYYLTIVMTYDGSPLKNQTSTFKIGPLSVVMADTLGGMGYIDHTSTYGSGDTLGPVYLPGGIPAHRADMMFYYNGTETLAGVTDVDASGHFKIWLDSSGTYDVTVQYAGYSSGKRYGITPTTP